jgi:uncharacterized membrane protein YhaH (DUF805 family)
MNWYLEVLKKYAVFSGRARRTEFWTFTLVNIAVATLLAFVDNSSVALTVSTGVTAAYGVGILSSLYSLAVLVPHLAVTVRRLHDTGRSGWWWLIGLVPIIGAVVLLIFAAQDSQPGSNEYGANPKSAAQALTV